MTVNLAGYLELEHREDGTYVSMYDREFLVVNYPQCEFEPRRFELRRNEGRYFHTYGERAVLNLDMRLVPSKPKMQRPKKRSRLDLGLRKPK